MVSSDLCLILSNLRAVQSGSQFVKKNLPNIHNEEVKYQDNHQSWFEGDNYHDIFQEQSKDDNHDHTHQLRFEEEVAF